MRQQPQNVQAHAAVGADQHGTDGCEGASSAHVAPPEKNCFTPSRKVFCLGVCLPPSHLRESLSSRSSARCSCDRCTGVLTTTRQNRSPRVGPRTDFTPFSRSRNTRPDWVSAGILSTTWPSSVGTSTLPPSVAVVKPMGPSQLR